MKNKLEQAQALYKEEKNKYLQKPVFFIEHQFGNTKPTYKWYEGINIKFMEMRNPKLYNQLIKMNCKAVMSLTIAACEWTLWRLCDWREKDSDLQKYYIQALWVSLISKEYLTKEEVYSLIGKDYSMTNEPIELINSIYNDLKYTYLVHDPAIYNIAVNMLELARYVSDNKDFFDDWFNTHLVRLVELFPVSEDDLGENGVFKYNADEDFNPFSIKEPFIPREFYFDLDFDYQAADLKQLQQELLDSVDYKENKFLSSPERMISIGFVGTPYKYEPNKRG